MKASSGRQWQQNREKGTARDPTLDSNLAAKSPHEMLDDREAETRPTQLA